MFSASMAVVPGLSYPAFDPSYKGPGIALSNLNHTATCGGYNSGVLVTKPIPPSSDKYWEYHIDTTPFSIGCGVALGTVNLYDLPERSPDGWTYRSNGQIINNSASAGTNSVYGSGSVVGVRYNSGTGQLLFYLNGVLQPYGFTGLVGAMFPVLSAGTGQVTINLGPTMAYTIPSGASLLTN